MFTPSSEDDGADAPVAPHIPDGLVNLYAGLLHAEHSQGNYGEDAVSNADATLTALKESHAELFA